MNIASSLFSLVKYNNGAFKSEKQAAFLGSKFDGDYYISVSNFHFGEWEGRTQRNTARVVYTFKKDAQGISEVTKQTSKGVQVYWTRKSESEFKAESVKREKKQALQNTLNVISARQDELVTVKNTLTSLPLEKLFDGKEITDYAKRVAKTLKRIEKHIDTLQCRWNAVEKQYSKA